MVYTDIDCRWLWRNGKWAEEAAARKRRAAAWKLRARARRGLHEREQHERKEREQRDAELP